VYYSIADQSVYDLCELVCGNIARQMQRTQDARQAFTRAD
jgi:hypothetical protein